MGRKKAEDSAKVIAIRPQEPEGGGEGGTGAKMRWPTREELEAEARARSLPAEKWGVTYCDLRDKWVEVRDEGLFVCSVVEDPETKGPRVKSEFVCETFSVEATTEPVDEAGQHGRRLRWRTKRGRIRSEVVPTSFAHESNNVLAKWLSDRDIGFKSRQRWALVDYISLADPPRRIACYSRTGWQPSPDGSKRVFVLHDRVLGAPDAVFQPDAGGDAAGTSSAGTLNEWLHHVAAPGCVLPWWRFAMMVGFAAPLLTPLQQEARIFHAHGNTTKGKSQGHYLGASIWGRGCRGNGGYVRGWRATRNALEGIAAAHNDILLALDEIGSGEAKGLAGFIYDFNSGRGKDRMDASARLKAAREWNTLAISNGEKTGVGTIEETGDTVRGGHVVRFIEVSVADGLIYDIAADEAGRIKDAAATYYGTAGPAFVEWLVSTGYADPASAKVDDGRRRLREITKSLAGDDYETPHIKRAADAFALVQLAGDLAVEAGVAPTEIAPAATVRMVFDSWRSGAGCDRIDAFREVARRMVEYIDEQADRELLRLGGQTADNDISEADLRAPRGGWYQVDGGSMTVFLLTKKLRELLKGVDDRAWKVAAVNEGALVRHDTETDRSWQAQLKVRGVNKRAYEVAVDALRAWLEGADSPARVPF